MNPTSEPNPAPGDKPKTPLEELRDVLAQFPQLKQLLSMVGNIVPADPRDERTVGQLVQAYLDATRNEVCARSAAGRKQVLGLFAQAHGGKRVADCTPADLLAFVNSRPTWRTEGMRSHVVHNVNACFNWGVRMRLIAANPFKGVPCRRSPPRRPMADAEFRALMRHADALFRRVLLFLRLTGCRPGEMAAMTWKDVDLDRGCVVLRSHKTARKTGKPRVIVLPPVLLRLLGWLWARGPFAARHVFVNKAGTPWNRSNLSLRLQRLRRAAGLPADCKLYGLRHKFATDGVKKGLNLKTLATLLGHTTTAMTEHYTHIAGDTAHLLEALKKLTQKPAGGGGGGGKGVA